MPAAIRRIVVEKYGAASRARTSDLVIFSHALSQLSYGGLISPYLLNHYKLVGGGGAPS